MLRENAESSPLGSDGAHLAETQQVVGVQNCDSKTDATQRAQTTATQESEDCNRCGDTHHAVKKLEIQAILTPKSLDIQLRKRIQDGYDLGCVKEICMPRRDSHCHIVIAHCRDYAIEWTGHNDSATLTAEFQQLYDHWMPGKYRVEICNFSFKYEMDVLIELLNAATIFYMSGVHGQARHTPMNVATEHVQQIIAALKRKVQSSEIVYWGVCGGAMLAGKSTTFVHTPFNLLEGTNVFYDAGISAKSCEMKTHAAKNILQITTGCAIAVMLTTDKDSCRAVSFPCIKNHAQWQKFAAESTRALHEWLEVKAHASSHWHFSNASTTCTIIANTATPEPTAPKHLTEHTTTTPSDGAHLAETPHVVGDPLAATTPNLFTFYGREKKQIARSTGMTPSTQQRKLPVVPICPGQCPCRRY